MRLSKKVRVAEPALPALDSHPRVTEALAEALGLHTALREAAMESQSHVSGKAGLSLIFGH